VRWGRSTDPWLRPAILLIEVRSALVTLIDLSFPGLTREIISEMVGRQKSVTDLFGHTGSDPGVRPAHIYSS
jgi:hypothetical protein